MFTKDGTAQGVAKQRLVESLASPKTRIIYDPYAERFILGASIMKLLGHRLNLWLTHKLIPGFHEHIISRTRFIDDLVVECSRAGVEQYVILGAGYDARAHRLALQPTLKIFEVDQPEVQNRKRSKLTQDTPNLDNVTYVSIDFNHQTIAESLIAAGFDQSKSTVFTLEGVSQYIEKEALALTIKELSALTQIGGGTFFMSYVDVALNNDPKTCFGRGYVNPRKKAKVIQALSARVGEPWISLYTSEEINGLLSQNDFSVTQHKTLAELNSVYFTPVGRTLPENHILKLETFVVAQR